MYKPSLKTHALVALFLSLLAAIAYAPILSLSFLSDDWAIIRLVTLPDAVTNWTEILRDFYTPLFFHDSSPFYRPLYTLSYGLNYSLFGTEPPGYHLTNLLLHLVSTVIVYLIALELVPGEKRWGVSVAAGALFAFYPVHPEAVTWIAGRVDLICAAFFLPATLFFLRWLRTERRLYLVLALASFGLSLMSKEMAVTLPGLLFLCAIYSRKGFAKAVISILPFALMLVAYLAFRTYVLSGVESYAVVSREFNISASIQGFLYRTFQMFVPVNFLLVPAEWRGLIGPLALLWPVPAVIFAGIAHFRNQESLKLPALLFTLYVVSLVPVLKALRPQPDLLSARWFYIPSTFFAILIAYVVWAVFAQRARWAALVSAVVCALFFALLLLNNGPWLRAGEMTARYLEAGETPDYPVEYRGAPVFINKITWISANRPPFEERP